MKLYYNRVSADNATRAGLYTEAVLAIVAAMRSPLDPMYARNRLTYALGCAGVGATVSVILLCAQITGCGDKKEEPVAAPAESIVAPLELPIALRSQGTAAPADAASIEVSMAAINVARKPVLTLAGGVVGASDRNAGGQDLPKLVQALNAGPHAKVSLAIASLVPYETVASVLASIKAAGASNVAFQVRSPASTTPGFLTLDNFAVRDKTGTGNDPSALVPGVAARPWSDFASQWDAVANGCRGARTGSCAFKPEKIAEGGELKIVLHAAGQGVNVEYFRIGAAPDASAAPEEPAAAGKKGAKAHKPKKKSKKHVEMIDGVKAPSDVAAEAETEAPATEALFQFRGQEALTTPSPVTETVKPVCGATACGVVVQAEKATAFLRVVSLLGAAFPDGTTAPTIVFELP